MIRDGSRYKGEDVNELTNQSRIIFRFIVTDSTA